MAVRSERLRLHQSNQRFALLESEIDSAISLAAELECVAVASEREQHLCERGACERRERGIFTEQLEPARRLAQCLAQITLRARDGREVNMSRALDPVIAQVHALLDGRLALGASLGIE